MPRRRFLKALAVPGGLLTVSQTLTQACGPAGPASSGGPPASSGASTKGPIRLGRLDTFTGPAASSGVAAKLATDLLIDQVRAEGGVIDGRQLEVEYFDGGGQLAEEINGFKKFGQDPSIVASVGQGINWAGGQLLADLSNKLKLPHFTGHHTPSDLSNYPYIVRPSGGTLEAIVNKCTDFVIQQLRAKSIALLADNQTVPRDSMSLMKQRLAAAGVTVTSEQYLEVGTTDASAIITRAKLGSPDVIAGYHTSGQIPLIFKQVTDLGGWGNAKFFGMTGGAVVGTIPHLAAAQNTFHAAHWAPGLLDVGGQKFEKAFAAKYGTAPDTSHSGAYIVVGTAIAAVRLAASTDRDVLAKAMRSGNVTWDAPGGSLTMRPSGENSVLLQVVQIQNGRVVPYWK